MHIVYLANVIRGVKKSGLVILKILRSDLSKRLRIIQGWVLEILLVYFQ